VLPVTGSADPVRDSDTVTSPEETTPGNLSEYVSNAADTHDGGRVPSPGSAGSGHSPQDKTREAASWTPADGAGLHPTRQAPVATAAAVDLEDATVTDVWAQLFEQADVRDAFVRSVREFASGRSTADLLEAFDDRDVPAHLHGKLLAVARGDRRRAWQLVADVVPSLGSGWSTVEDVLATASLFDVSPRTPTVAIHVGQGFRERRRDQREDVCSLLATLARGVDVRLVTTGLTRVWLAREHRADLPGVSEWRSADRTQGPLDAVVDEALAALDPDGREVSLLRDLADEPGETLSYHSLYAAASVDESRVRQCLGTLADLGLVESFGPSTDRKVELLEAGRALLSELSRQITLDDGVSETPQHHPQAVYHADTSPAPDDSSATAGADRGPYRTRYMGRPQQHAAAACAPDGGVGLVRAPLTDEDADDARRTRLVTYDEERDEAVVSVRATGALQLTVSVALALASPRLFDAALPVDRLEAIDDPPAILRDARCIGGLSDEALADGEVLRDALVEWGEDLADMTRDLKEADQEDLDGRRSAIMRSAHGLAGTIVHLLDVAGVDLVREVRVPGGLDGDHLDELARSIGIGAAIQSRYGAFAVYRQLFEHREDKRQRSLTPDVDAADPLGRLIGGFILRGPDVDRLQPALEDHIATPRELAEEVPELAVHVPLERVGRSAFATAATRLLSAKHLRPSSEAVSLLQALVGTPYDATRALQQLSPEDQARDVRPDELRYALATLPSDRITPTLPPTAGAIVATLLAATEPLPQAILAERADVATESVRRHRDRLEALGLLDREGTTYRLALSFRTTEERRQPVTPDAPDRFVDAVGALLEVALPAERYADPGDPVAGTLFHPPDPWGVVNASASLEPWVRLAAALTATDPPDRAASVSVGPPLEQASLDAATTQGVTAQ